MVSEPALPVRPQGPGQAGIHRAPCAAPPGHSCGMSRRSGAAITPQAGPRGLRGWHMGMVRLYAPPAQCRKEQCSTVRGTSLPCCLRSSSATLCGDPVVKPAVRSTGLPLSAMAHATCGTRSRGAEETGTAGCGVLSPGVGSSFIEHPHDIASAPSSMSAQQPLVQPVPCPSPEAGRAPTSPIPA